MTKRKAANTHKPGTPVLEWVLGVIGVVLLIACVGFLIYEGTTNHDRPGAITASIKEIVSDRDVHIVTFELHNAGSQALSNVFLSARIMEGEREIERVRTIIDYLPGHSRQEGGFYFKNDPRALRVEITPEGYQNP